ncbi:pyridoxamine 5'-phosphate oxidase family protein [Paenibacillus gansuensis]|uniref:Pyridoxamine 5'-phosphate oxidase family protein n=1 Tax=Paenibacillus gansuensis TaxID=306542 RepID=A0ABW5PAZ4_9BACL
MFPIRVQRRTATDTAKIQNFLARAQTGFLGLSSEGVPYVIPLNFVWLNDAIYFHGAQEGRKISYIEHNPLGCFTVGEDYGTITDVVPANTDTAYMSVIIEGTITLVNDSNEATDAMQAMLDKYVPGYYDRPLAKSHLERYVSSLGSKTAVYKLAAASLSAKENEPVPSKMYYEGRTIHTDRAK